VSRLVDLTTVDDVAHDLEGAAEPSTLRGFPAYSGLVDSRVGIIRSLQLEPDLYNDEPKLPTYRADVSPTAGFSDGGYEYHAAAGGRGVDGAEAKLKAVFEALERYCLSIYRRVDQRRDTYAGLSRNGEYAVNPANLTGQSRDDRVRLAELAWVRGRSLGQGRDVWVPAQAIYLPYAFDAGEVILRDPVTTGAAAGFSSAAAIARGVLEVVERDALMIRHYGRIPPRRIDLAALSRPEAKALVDSALRYGLGLDAFQMSLDLPVHVVAVRIRDPSGLGPSTVLGAKAHMNLDEAFVGAFLEAVTFRRQLRDRAEAMRRRGEEIAAGKRAIQGLEDRAALWGLPSYGDRLAYLDHAALLPLEAPFDHPDLSLSVLLHAVSTAAGDLVVVDVTTPDVARLGVVVVRVVTPLLQWMHLAEDGAAWSARLARASDKRPFNHDPHPYV
jgi:ribosomal protein S12 methylthiotransferase accessory factor